jgi:DNA-binding NarL/FixJ family response regulator
MTARPPIRLVLVEDNETFRTTLELLFAMRDDLAVVASIESGKEAAQICAELQPDVVLMDYRMPGLNGAEATRGVLEVCPTARVICLTASVSRVEVDELRKAGVVACVTKDEDFEHLIATIRGETVP